MVSSKSQKEEMFSLVEAYHNRQDTQKEFLIENNLKYSQFSYWINQYSKKYRSVDSEDFVKLTPNIKSSASVIVTLPNGITISGNQNEVVSTSATLFRLLK